MSRPLRLEFPGALYHVMARGNERKAVFRDETDRERYLKRLAHYREKFGFRLYAFCLMDNHVHLAIEAGPVPLSRAMLGIQGSYTQAFNRRHRRVGHLFQGRYKAFLVEKDSYLLALIRYIHENPVKAGVVERPGQYVWSSDRYYRRGKGPEWLDMDDVLGIFGPRRSVAVRNYRDFMGQDEENPYEEVRSYAQAVKGDEAFAERVLKEVGQSDRLERRLSVGEVVGAVARWAGLEVREMRGPSRRREVSRARAIAGHVGRHEGRIPLARMARYFSRDGSTLVRGVSQLEAELRESPQLARRLGAIAKTLQEIHTA